MRARAALLSLLLTGCAAEVLDDAYATPEQDELAVAAIWAWQDRIGAAPECDADQVVWSAQPRDQVQRVCGLLGVTDFDGCLRVRADGRYLLTVLDTPSVAWRQLVEAHELAHWLERCSGRWPHGDALHADTLVWPAQVRTTLQLMR